LTLDGAVAAGIGCRPGVEAAAARLSAARGVEIVAAPAGWALDELRRIGAQQEAARIERWIG
jgi:hypothetical protein